ncbi:hypothetical protein SISNIDRAFT_402728, partial [Sistotremastrum niveocremeum HHB9708]
MTANPNWPEILAELLPGQTVYDQPDLVSRVFHMKKNAVLRDIYTLGIFGRVVAHVYVIEFQKRGLPHMHLLIFLHHDDRLKEPRHFEHMIRAELPDPVTEPELYEAV